MSDTPASSAVLHEIMAYEKRNGKKPALIVFCNIAFKEKFFNEAYQAVMQNEVLDFKTPGSFYGVPFAHRKIWSYGGSCDWMIVGEL